MNNFVSIIVPCFNEEKYIKKCIESILQQDYPKEHLEILLIDGMSTDKTRGMVEEYIANYPFIRLLDNPYKIVPHALNIGIKGAKGDIIIRLDVHAHYPHNYFSVLVDKLQSTHADNVGGVCKTLPINDTTECKAIAIALSSRFGMGNSYFRVGSDKEMQVDTVPFGCFSKEVFDKIGLFDEELVRNQDDEFNGRIIKNGGKIILIPSLSIEYYARDTIKKVSRMYYQYGLFKPLVNKKLGKPATVRQFFPAIFLSGLVLGAILSFFSPLLMIIYFTVITLYLIIGIAIGIKKAKQQKDFKLIYYLPFTFFIIHISYGFGYWTGIYKIFCKQKITVQANR